VLTFIMGGVQLTVFRRTAPNLERPFRLPAARIMAPLGFLAAVMIFYWAGYDVLTYVFAAVFLGLPIYTWVHAPRRGYQSARAGTLIGVPFLAAWVVIEYFGDISRKSLPHGLYFALLSAAVLVYTGLVYLVSNEDGRFPIRRSGWVLFLLLGTYVLSYYGTYGPLDNPPVPYDNLVALGVGIVAYYWAVASGYETAEIREITQGGGSQFIEGDEVDEPRAGRSEEPATA
jgi:amino acid transporter